MRVVYLLFVCVVLLSGGCSFFGDKKDETEGLTDQQLYDKGRDAMDSGYYSDAIKFYEALQNRYPFGPYAKQAQLDLAYSYYKSEEPAAAVAACNRFIKLYPTNEHIDYAYYLKGLSVFNQGKGLTERFLPVDSSQRDQEAARNAFQSFSELIRKYPDSEYVEDSRQRMIYLRNILAEHEVEVATYYMRRGAYLAAANRASSVVQYYQGAPAMPDALVVMAKAYRVLELDDLADDALRVLESNYPNHPGIEQVREITIR